MKGGGCRSTILEQVRRDEVGEGVGLGWEQEPLIHCDGAWARRNMVETQEPYGWLE